MVTCSALPSLKVAKIGRILLSVLAFTRHCLPSSFVGVYHPFDCLPTCKAYTNAILLQDYCATYDPHPRPTVCIPYTVQYWWQYLVKGKLWSASRRRSLSSVCCICVSVRASERGCVFCLDVYVACVFCDLNPSLQVAQIGRILRSVWLLAAARCRVRVV